MNIFVTRSVWTYVEYVEDDIYKKLVASVPKNIVGGLFPRSRLKLLGDTERQMLCFNINGHFAKINNHQSEVLNKSNITGMKTIA